MQKIRGFIVCCKLFRNQGKLREDTFQLVPRIAPPAHRDALAIAPCAAHVPQQRLEPVS
jgi:hypothetical protein